MRTHSKNESSLERDIDTTDGPSNKTDHHPLHKSHLTFPKPQSAVPLKPPLADYSRKMLTPLKNVTHKKFFASVWQPHSSALEKEQHQSKEKTLNISE